MSALSREAGQFYNGCRSVTAKLIEPYEDGPEKEDMRRLLHLAYMSGCSQTLDYQIRTEGATLPQVLNRHLLEAGDYMGFGLCRPGDVPPGG